MPNSSSWNNGAPNHQTGAGLGLHIYRQYQPTIFDQNFETIDIYYNNQNIASNVNVANRSCPELIDIQIGLWLIRNNWGTWQNRNPYKFTLSQREDTNVFDIVFND